MFNSVVNPEQAEITVYFLSIYMRNKDMHLFRGQDQKDHPYKDVVPNSMTVVIDSPDVDERPQEEPELSLCSLSGKKKDGLRYRSIPNTYSTFNFFHHKGLKMQKFEKKNSEN